MSEQEKVIKKLEEMTKNYSLNSEDLHYAIILYCLIINLQQENKQLKENWNKLKKELKDKFKEYRYVEDECLRTMAQEDDSILFSMSCIEKGDSND